MLVTVVLGAMTLGAARAAEQPPPDAGLSIVGALLGVWVASLLGDRSAPVADGTPPPLLFRRAIRLVVGLPFVTVAWVAALASAAEGPHATTLSVLLGAQILVATGVAAVGIHLSGPGREVLWATGGLLIVFVALPFALGVDLSPIAAVETWWTRAGRWLCIGTGGGFAFVLASRDPAARTVRARIAPRPVPAPATPPVR